VEPPVEDGMVAPARIGLKHTDPAALEASRRSRIVAGNTHEMRALFQEDRRVDNEHAAEIDERG
jgi:hypothetical protein